MGKTTILKKGKEKEKLNFGLAFGLVAVALAAALIIFGPKGSELIALAEKAFPSLIP